MVRQEFLLTLLLVALAPLGLAAVTGRAADVCSTIGQVTGTCSTGSIAGDHVDVGAEAGAGTANGDIDPDAPPTTPDPRLCGAETGCRAGFDFTSLTMSDLASFYPTKPGIASEPNGWAVVGLDTNFVSNAAAHAVSGRLLKLPASVRFTPTRFVWDYGDGYRRTTTTGGSTWKQLAVAEFTPTVTSHVYSTAGSYRVELAVAYTAQYRFDGAAWHDVPGTLTLRAPTETVVASGAATVLVQRDCRANPRGPGC